MRSLDSRRLTGRHLLLPGPGAAIEVAFDPGEDREAALAPVVEHAAWLAGRFGLPPGRPGVRHHRAGASVAVAAAEDQLETACGVLDHAFAAATGGVGLCLDELDALSKRESNPRLRACLAWAEAAGVPAFQDEDGFTLGMGRHARTWPLRELPDRVDLERRRDELARESAPGSRPGAIPVCLVTGTNGKTTTTRLIARAGEASGLVAGHTSSDGIRVGPEWTERGDWTGPGAARRLLRDPRVEVAVVESARGGLLRRGVALAEVDAAVVTNVSSDHLGEWGIDDVDAMAGVKLLVADAVRPGGAVVLNGSCEPLVHAWRRRGARGARGAEAAWFGADLFDGPTWLRWARQRGLAAAVVDGVVEVRTRTGYEAVLEVGEIPITLGGAAPHNVANALAAAAAAVSLGLPVEGISRGLADFRPTPEDSPGRTNVLDVRGTRVLVDFAHNPDGMRHVGALAARLAAGRRLLLIGQAGDRSDDDVRAFVREALRFRPDRVLVKALPGHLRGRPPGEIPELIAGLLAAGGVSRDRIGRVTTEVEATREALAWARPGDVLLLLVHEEWEAVVDHLRAEGATAAGG